MKKLHIAVTQRVDAHPSRNEFRDALDQRIAMTLTKAGFLTFPVPNVLFTIEIAKQWCEASKIDAFLLSGGNTIGSCQDRDLTEKNLLSYAKGNCLPVFGICRGMQMLVQYAGGSLKKADGHVKTYHNLGGKIRQNVNSYHSYVVEILPTEYEVIACAEDRTIEAIRHKILPWEGIMWHPEREIDFLEDTKGSALTVFRDFFTAKEAK